jgi:hypothetical protein
MIHEEHTEGAGIRCRFDEASGILHIHLEAQSVDDLPSNGDLLEIISHHRRNRKLNGVVIFPREHATHYAATLRLM